MQSLPSAALKAAIVASLLASGVLAQGSSCWEPNYGTVQATGDDSVTPAQTLNFAFPLPGGGTTNQITACTNGYVWLDGTSTIADYSVTVGELLTGAPRICAGWVDLDCDPTERPENGVYVNTSFTDHAVVTWISNDQIFATSGNNHVIMQLTLNMDGSFSITHRQVDQYPGTSTLTWHDMIVGVSQGGAAIDPGEVDFSAGAVMGGSNPTVYEIFDNPVNNPNDPRDIDTIPTLLFVPNMSGGYAVAGMPCGPFASHNWYGNGCPVAARDGAFYELFDGTTSINDIASLSGLLLASTPTGYAVTSAPIWEPGFSNVVAWDNAGSGDDSLSTQTLPFTANFGGVVTNAIQIDSNGSVFLTGAGNTSDFSESGADFVNNGPRVAALWDDLNNNATAGGGTVYYDTFPATMSSPARAVITWSMVPEYGNTANTNTFQVQLLDTGDIVIGYQQVSITDGLVGFSIGGGVTDPGSVDISASLPLAVATSVAEPMSIGTSAEPILGTTISVDSTGLNGSVIGVTHLGLTSQNTALDFIGMTGCTWLASIDYVLPMPISAGIGSTMLPIPNIPSLAGASVFTQSVAVKPGINPLGIFASNGLELVLGVN